MQRWVRVIFFDASPHNPTTAKLYSDNLIFYAKNADSMSKSALNWDFSPEIFREVFSPIGQKCDFIKNKKISRNFGSIFTFSNISIMKLFS